MKRLAILSSTLLTLGSLHAQEWLDRIDDSLFIQSRDGNFRLDVSGLADLETYYIDELPPGLIFTDDEWFFNPRLSLFVDARLGDHLYGMVQVRFDRGFDPAVEPDGDARFDEYLLRYTPFDNPTLNIQAGKFATVLGNWVARHDSWNNPFINAPAPYEHVMVVSDTTAARLPGFLNRKNLPDNKVTWNSMFWGPVYATGASVFGMIERFEYAFEIKNAALSSRPPDWEYHPRRLDHPNFGGRIGYRPNAAWNVGANASYGPYLREVATGLAAGESPSDYTQLTVGPDVSFAWRHWQFWAEAYASRFEVPYVGEVETVAYYLETKYKITESLFAGVRWNQQLFEDIPNVSGGEEPWDRDFWRTDFSIGYRFNRHWQAKLQYSYSHLKGQLQQGEQSVAAQLTLKF